MSHDGGCGKVTRYPALTFGPESEYSLVVVAAGDVYGYRCVDGQEKPFTGPTTLAHPEKPSAWRYFDGKHWSADQGDARATGPQCGSGLTVQRVPTAARVNYALAAHPLSRRTAASPNTTYRHPDDDRQHVLKVVLENTS